MDQCCPHGSSGSPKYSPCFPSCLVLLYNCCCRALLLEELRAALAAAHEELVSSGSRSFTCLPLIIDSVARHSSIHLVTARIHTSSLGPRDRDREGPRERDFVLLTKAPLGSAAELAEGRLPHSHLSGEVQLQRYMHMSWHAWACVQKSPACCLLAAEFVLLVLLLLSVN